VSFGRRLIRAALVMRRDAFATNLLGCNRIVLNGFNLYRRDWKRTLRGSAPGLLFAC
jgi:hypothetical protein